MSTEPELKKLTVPQLKALCKERDITGYSKLGKEALICKLLGITPPAAPSAGSTSADPNKPSTTVDSTTQSKPPPKKKKKVAASAPLDPSTAPSSASASEPPSLQALTAFMGESSASSTILPVTSASEPVIQKDTPTETSSTSVLTLSITEPPSTSSAPTTGSSSAAVDKEPAAKPKKRKNPPSSDPSAIPQQNPVADASAEVAVAPKKKKKKVAETETDGTTPAPKKKKKKAVVDDNNSAPTPESSDKTTSNSSLSTNSSTVTKRPLDAVTPASVDADAQPSKKQKLVASAPKPRPATTDLTNGSSASASTILSTTSSAPAVTERPLNATAPTAVVPPLAKKQKVPSSVVSKLPTTSKFVLPLKAPAPMASPVAPPIVPPKDKAAQPPTTLPKVSQKRFKPLMVVKKTPAPNIATQTPVVPATPQSLYHLEFPPAPTPASLFTITLPPPMSQRKRAVPRFALLLSQVSEADLVSCLLVSRMFRYAVYLSASHRLNQAFAGKRLSAFLAALDAKQLAMLNMWPYLKQRQQECSARQAEYQASFLSRVFPSNTISEHLWGSPDHERQIVIVLRFLLTRLFFQISVGGSKQGKSWIEGQVVDAQQLVPDEVWAITVRHSTGALESFYVLEATCEPLATLTDPQQAELPVRTDWSAYIAHRTSRMQKLPPPRCLLEYLSWTNHEDYLRGISRVWLKRIEGEGETGNAKRIVAERYILACVVGNSVSGRWMSATAMAQEFAGLDAGVPGHTGNTTPKVNLFLPKHHHVEGVYFTTSGPTKAPVHPALAVLQTPDREYYILRDNGMQVGCEEDGGVAEVWMGLIGCNKSGVALYR